MEGAQGGDKDTTPLCAGLKIPSCEIIYAAAVPNALKRMASIPFAIRHPASKIKVGNFKVSIRQAVDYETFQVQEYVCTVEMIETYACVELVVLQKKKLKSRPCVNLRRCSV